jgi:hypothetical protein
MIVAMNHTVVRPETTTTADRMRGGWVRCGRSPVRPFGGDLELPLTPPEQGHSGGEVGRQPDQVEHDRQPGPLPAPTKQPQRQLLQREGDGEGDGEGAERGPDRDGASAQDRHRQQQ